MPDQPDQPASGSAVIQNVFPRTLASYGGINAPVAVYNALNSRCRGGFGVHDKFGNVFMFAGSNSDLYLLKAGGTDWVNKSVAPGFYDTGVNVWNFVYFNGQVITTNYTAIPQHYILSPESSVFSFLSGAHAVPRAKYIAVVKNAFLALGNTYDDVNGEMPQRVWWSAAGDPENWPVLGTDEAAQVQSGAVDLLGGGGDVQGFAPDLINADAVVFMEYGLRRMMYAGPPDVFSFLPVENARGTPAPSSIVVQGGIAYYWGQDGIYAFDGGSSQPIGAGKVDKFLLGDGNQVGDVNMAHIKRVVGAADALNKLIWWAYPSTASSGNPDRLLCYSWELGRFSLVLLTCETIFRLLSVDATLGSKLQIALFDATHKMNFFTGGALAATVDTQELQPVPGRRVFIRNSRPMVDGLSSAPTVAIGHRERLQDAVSFSPAVALNAMGMCPVRRSGRLVRGRITVPADATTWSNISGIELDVVPQGSR